MLRSRGRRLWPDWAGGLGRWSRLVVGRLVLAVLLTMGAALGLMPRPWPAAPDAFAASLGYARSVGGNTIDVNRGVAVDGNGNAYLAGYFAGTADFDPGA